MACDATTIQAAIASNGLDKLSERDLLICIAGNLGATASFANATAAVARSYSNGLPKLSDRDLLICLASVVGTNGGFANAQAAVNQNFTNKLAKLSDRELWAGFMVAVCSSCTATTLISTGMLAGYGKLSWRDLVEVILAATEVSAQSATTTIATAMAAGYGKLSERDLMEAIVSGECIATTPSVKTEWITGGLPPTAALTSAFCVGAKITAVSNVTVTDLGCYVSAIMTGTVSLGIWTDAGVLLGTTTVNTATSTIGIVNYSSLAPSVSLTAGSSYRIAMLSSTWYDQKAYTVTADVTDVASAFVASAVIAFPSSLGNAGQIYGLVSFKYTKP